MWEESFVAVSVLLGGSIDDALRVLPEGAEARVAELAARLRDPRRAARAQSLAAVAQKIAFAVGEGTLR